MGSIESDLTQELMYPVRISRLHNVADNCSIAPNPIKLARGVKACQGQHRDPLEQAKYKGVGMSRSTKLSSRNYLGGIFHSK